MMADEAAEPARVSTTEAPAPARADVAERPRGITLLGRESALARISSGEVRQVTQLLLDPARVAIWPGNARAYAHLSEENCRELLDSLVAEGGQKVPAVVRRREGDPDHDYEVIAGTCRHWSVSWLRRHSYPDMAFLAQVATLDDEAAFRLADLEDRARKDVSDLERARSYAAALASHYGNHLTRMAERLKLSKGWLSKMLEVASLPDAVVDALASPTDVQLKPAYALARLLDDKAAVRSIVQVAAVIASEQHQRREAGEPAIPAADVLRRLMDAPFSSRPAKPDPYRHARRYGRTALTIEAASRQGVTLRLHSGSGADREEVIAAIRDTLDHLDREGKGLQQ